MFFLDGETISLFVVDVANERAMTVNGQQYKQMNEGFSVLLL